MFDFEDAPRKEEIETLVKQPFSDEAKPAFSDEAKPAAPDLPPELPAKEELLFESVLEELPPAPTPVLAPAAGKAPVKIIAAVALVIVGLAYWFGFRVQEPTPPADVVPVSVEAPASLAVETVAPAPVAAPTPQAKSFADVVREEQERLDAEDRKGLELLK